MMQSWIPATTPLVYALLPKDQTELLRESRMYQDKSAIRPDNGANGQLIMSNIVLSNANK